MYLRPRAVGLWYLTEAIEAQSFPTKVQRCRLRNKGKPLPSQVPWYAGIDPKQRDLAKTAICEDPDGLRALRRTRYAIEKYAQRLGERVEATRKTVGVADVDVSGA